MASTAQVNLGNQFLHAANDGDDDGEFVVQHPGSAFERRQRRNANLFDAVAGRVSYKHRLDSLTSFGDSNALHPDEVLFRSARAPPRYQESDIYWANEHLSSSAPAATLSPLSQVANMEQSRLRNETNLERLPDSDLLKAVHQYAADLYRRKSAPNDSGMVVDTCNMDETALLAFGILLEETTNTVLGATGERALVEGGSDSSGGNSRGGSFGSNGAEEMMAMDVDRGDMPMHRTKRRRMV